MSYYPPQNYGSYQTPYTQYSQPGQYSSQYPQGSLAAYPAYPPGGVKQGSPPPEAPAPAVPVVPSVTPELASRALQRLLSVELRDIGFDSAEPAALKRLELDVAAFVERLYQRAHEYANLANRAGPIATDVFLASEECGLHTKELREIADHTSKRAKIEPYKPTTLLPPPSRSPSPELLSSDDEGAPRFRPVTLRTIPHYVPPLPPKHTYLRTPIAQTKKTAIPSLNKRLDNAALVQKSLKSLLEATEENKDKENELLGAIVNWETTTHPRKRWKLT